MRKIFNKKQYKNLRRKLRNNPSLAEYRLWYFLKNRNLFQYKFRRQHSIGSYIVDFYCPKLKLVIEIDGDSHFTENQIEYDQRREEYLVSLGVKIIRFNNTEIYGDIESVIERIIDITNNHP